MSRLIDADKLPKYTGYALSADEVAKAVEEAPTVDAVEVVRCKECRHCFMDIVNGRVGYTCLYRNGLLVLDGYCDKGEKKDEV